MPCRRVLRLVLVFFFFNDTATTEIYTLSLHDALPISCVLALEHTCDLLGDRCRAVRSEEHTSELQSRLHLVCRLLLETKKHNNNTRATPSPPRRPPAAARPRPSA